MKDVFQKLSNLEAGLVLDAATGRGEFIRVLKHTLGSFDRIIGIDVNDAAVNQAQSLFPENNIEIFRMNLDELNFADAYFDTVCISNSLHHLEHPEHVFTELLRVLKPGGNMIILEMYQDGIQSPPQLTHIQMHHWISKIDTLNGVFHRSTFCKAELVALVQNLPLENLEIVDSFAPSEDPLDPAELAPLIKKVQDWIKRCKSVSIAEEICSEGHQIIERMKTFGCLSASKLFFTATKKN